MLDSDEVEVETSQILKGRRLKLRTVDRAVLPIVLNVFECESPYVMIFIISISETYSLRMDIQKGDLARELGLWLEGKNLENPAFVTSSQGERLMQQFIKFGKAPSQEDLILWILSRSELDLGRVDCMRFGGAFAGNNVCGSESSFDEMTIRESTFYMDNGSNHFNSISSSASYPVLKSHTCSEPHMSMNANTSDCLTRDPFETFKLTRTLLGQSSLISEMAARKPKNRAGMKQDHNTRLLRSQLNMLGG